MNANVRALAETSPYAAQRLDDDYSDFTLKGPPISGLVQLASGECDSASPRFIAGAAPGLIVLRFAVDDAKVVKSFVFTPFGTESRFPIYEPSRGGERGAYVETLAQKPAEARWQAGANGKRQCLLPDGREVRQTTIVFMLVERRPIAFATHSSGLKPIGDFIDRAARLKTEGAPFRGPIIGKWSMATSEQRQGTYRWWTPQPLLLGKLGDKNGPTVEDCEFAKAVRESFRDGRLAWGETPALTGPTEASLATTEAPPPIESVDASYAGVDLDDIDFS